VNRALWRVFAVIPLISACGPSPPNAPDTTAAVFVDVTVVPMDSERLLPHQTVVVRDRRIAEIGPAAQVRAPRDARRIDGRGKYLMPGLADMHAHPETKLDLLLYVADGVTTVRTMGSPPDLRPWRADAAANRLVSPSIYTAGAVLDGSSDIYQGNQTIRTPAEAVQAVRQQHADGYDFIKVYNSLSKDVYEAIIAEARRLGMPVAGHVPLSVGLRGALAARQASIEHLRGYAAELVRAGAAAPGLDLRSRTMAWNDADESRFSTLAQATRDAGVWNCPTLVWMQTQLVPRAVYARWVDRPEMRFAPPEFRSDTRSQLPFLKNFTEADYVAAQRTMPVQQRFVKSLHDAGARILLGTDLGGFAVSEELGLLAGAGLTPYEVLRSGTRDAAEFINQLDVWGTVSVGKRADLVLVDANPLADVANATRRTGVMLRGRWLPGAETARLLRESAAAASPTTTPAR